MQNDASPVYRSRVRPQQGVTGAAEMEIEDESDRNLEQDLSATGGFREHIDLIPSMLTARATKMFIGGAGAARTSQEPAIATSATHWLIKLAKEAVWQLFDLHQRRRIWALRRLSHPPAKPPCRFIDRQGSWFDPTWRDGGVEPSTPS